MKSTIELLEEMVGFLILLFSAVWVFVRLTGYGEFYDKMLYDDESDNYLAIKKGKDKKDDEDDLIHHVSISTLLK